MNEKHEPEIVWHGTGELAMKWAEAHPRYVAVEFDDPREGLSWATTLSAPWLAEWLEGGRARVIYTPTVRTVGV